MSEYFDDAFLSLISSMEKLKQKLRNIDKDLISVKVTALTDSYNNVTADSTSSVNILKVLLGIFEGSEIQGDMFTVPRSSLSFCNPPVRGPRAHSISANTDMQRSTREKSTTNSDEQQGVGDESSVVQNSVSTESRRTIAYGIRKRRKC